MRQVQFISLIAVIFICCSYFNYESTYPIPSFVSFTNIKGPVNYRWEMRKSAWKSSLMNKYLAKVMHERRRSYRCISSTQKNEEWTLSYCLSTTLKVKKKGWEEGGWGGARGFLKTFCCDQNLSRISHVGNQQLWQVLISAEKMLTSARALLF